MSEKTERVINNGQSRDTGNIGYTRHRTKINTKTLHYTENLKEQQHGPHQKTGRETRCSWRVGSSLLISLPSWYACIYSQVR